MGVQIENRVSERAGWWRAAMPGGMATPCLVVRPARSPRAHLLARRHSLCFRLPLVLPVILILSMFVFARFARFILLPTKVNKTSKNSTD